MANFYDHVRANKFKSAFLMLVVLVLVIGVVALYSWYVRGDFTLPIIAAIIAIPSSLIGYYQGDKIALMSNRAQELPDAAAPDVHNIVENLALTIGVPKPRLYIMHSPA